MHIKPRKYKKEYAAETKRLGEYIADARNNRPSKKANFKMDRTCFGIRIDSAEAKRYIARIAIAASKAT
jgi:hypothetical protein